MSDPVYAMPSMGADMERGTVLQWLVGPGDEVHRGDIVAVIDTEKAEIEAEIFADGTIAELLVPVGVTVPVGTALARLTPLGAAPGPGPVTPPAARPAVGPLPPAPPPLTPAAVPVTPAAVPVTPIAAPTAVTPAAARATVTYSPLVRHEAERRHIDLRGVAGSGPGRAVTRHDVEHAAVAGPRRSSPLARRLASEAGLALEGLVGSGPGGAVVARDVTAASVASRAPSTPGGGPAAAQAAPATVAATRPPAPVGTVSRLRRALGDLMSRSKREIPHYYLATDIDCGAALRWLTDANEARPVASRILPAALLLRATALAARDVPDLNGFWIDGELQRAERVNVGVAISLREGGLVAPAIHDADRLSLDELMAALGDLVARARRGKLRSSEMSDPTITVTNLGDQGVGAVYGVIYPPQVALVGFGRITERPWAEAGLLGVRPVVTATLSADHRATDGHVGARFLGRIARLLGDPDRLR